MSPPDLIECPLETGCSVRLESEKKSLQSPHASKLVGEKTDQDTYV